MIENLKKVELHVHLDGSIRIDTLQEFSGLSKEEVEKLATASSHCNDLNEYLKKFEFILKYLQTEENLLRVTKELIEDLEKENVLYAEIRFAPILHTKKGLSLTQVMSAVLKGSSLANIPVRFILCMMRGESMEENKKILYLAKKYRNDGVCAVDLAGAEALFSNELYKDLFFLAKKMKIPYTIHAGEAAGKNSIRSAISLGATRIGHGIHIENDQNMIQTLKEKNILLEICPTSNTQTMAVSSIKEHPVYQLYSNGIDISINTDNRCVSNTNLNKEYKILKDTFPFTKEDFLKIQKTAIEHSFLTGKEKEKLLKKIEK